MAPSDDRTFISNLRSLAERGVTADVAPLLADMCSQFANPHEWIREYVANAYDANARRVEVRGKEGDGVIVISVIDDGDGMDAEAVRDFFTVFRSRKQTAEGRESIGRHGVGKLSVAAVPGQLAFRMLTSTGREAWAAELGKMLEPGPFRCERVDPPPRAGTRFDIVFEPREPLDTVLSHLELVLRNSARYLPVEIDIAKTAERAAVSLGFEPWVSGPACRRHQFRAGGCRCDAVLYVGSPAAHTVYQSKVLISSRYNLLSNDENSASVPHLSIRLDSPDFELPFGRHALANEQVLGPIAEHLREHSLVEFVEQLAELYSSGRLARVGVNPLQVEEMACALLSEDAAWEGRLDTLPLFFDATGKSHSLAALRELADEAGALYLEPPGQPGRDFGGLDVTVLAQRQHFGGLAALERVFGERLLPVDDDDFVMEAPGSRASLGQRELRLEDNLRFHPKALQRLQTKAPPAQPRGGERLRGSREGFKDQAISEFQEARQELSSIRWRVDYLVRRDGRTHCTDRRLLVRGDLVILNLHHPDVADLVALADFAPALAGHWGLALAIEDRSHKLFDHLSPATRDDLILTDAMAKIAAGAAPDPEPDSSPERDNDEALRRYLRYIENDPANVPASFPDWSMRRRPGSA